MNEIVEIILTITTIIILLILFYMYMNWVRDQYINFEKGDIKELSWYIPPIWVKDAWDPTWATIQRSQVKLRALF